MPQEPNQELPQTQYLWSWRVHNGYTYEPDDLVDWYEQQRHEHAEWRKNNYSWLSPKRLQTIFGLIKPPAQSKYLTTEELLERVDLYDVVSQYAQVTITRDGECMAKCPFHEDRLASLNFNRANGLWVCHAGCGGGTAIHFIMKAEGIEYLEAKDLLSSAI